MGFFSFSHAPMLSGVLAPVRALAARFRPVQSASNQFCVPAGTHHAPDQRALPLVSSTSTIRHRSANDRPGKTGAKTPFPCRLKVVRESDSVIGPACTGRMVVSGRMADVCAELERMAQRGTAAQ